MLSMGICLASGTLAVSMAVSGHAHPRLSDFSVAFLTVTAISITASPVCLRLPINAGDVMSGYRPRKARA